MEHSHKLLKQAIAAGLALGMAHGALANEDKITKGFYSMDAMGCMLLKECTNGVERINSSIDLMNAYPDANWDYVKVPEGDCGKIEIENPNYFNQVRLLDAMNPKIKEDMIAFTSMWFPPVEGTGLIFPSNLTHRVSENNTQEDRISISWNMSINF